MKKSILLSILFIYFISTANGQGKYPCGFDLVHKHQMLADSNYKKVVDQLNNRWVKAASFMSSALLTYTSSGYVYEIPMVIHVLHTGDTVGSKYNPDSTKIAQMVAYLNKAYAAASPFPDTNSGGTRIPLKFILAKRTPTGASSNGIVRIDASGLTNYTSYGINAATSFGVDPADIAAFSRWPSADYYNVYCVNKIDGNDLYSTGGIAGFAYFPGYPVLDGMYVAASQVKSGSTTVAHEFGHAFSLYHTFEGDASGTSCPSTTGGCSASGDYVCDTEPHIRESSAFPSTWCPPTDYNACTGGSYNNTQYNIMDYTTCPPDRFTAGQRTRLLNTLENERTGYKSSLGLQAPLGTIPSACSPSVTYPKYNIGPYIVDFNGMNIWTGDAALEDTNYVDHSYTQQSKVVRGKSYTISVTTKVNVQKVRVFIDYNADGDFTDAGENVFSHNGSTSTEVHSGSFTIPTSISTCQFLRMRVVADYTGSTVSEYSCGTLGYGQVEDYGIYVQSDTPSVSTPVAYCTGVSATALTATGTGLKWYTSDTGSTGSSTAPTPSTATAGSTTYYVSKSDDGSSYCEGGRTAITVNVSTSPSAPSISTPVSYCIGSTATTLTATGTSLLWYTSASGGTGSSTAPTPNTLIADTTIYYVSQTTGSCESPRAAISVIVNPALSAPTVSTPISYCIGASASALTATGTYLRWYTSASGGTSTSTITPSTTSAGTTTYFVSQSSDASGGCESARDSIKVVVNPALAAPSVTSPVSYCIGSTATALTATGTYLRWYTVASGGTSSSTITPSTGSVGTTTYYVSQSSDASGACESLRDSIKVIVSSTISPPTVSSPVNYCLGASSSALTASGTGLLWYTSATGGIGSSTAPNPSTASLGSTTYYVSQTSGICESPRDSIIVVVNAGTTTPTFTSPIRYCKGSTATALSATAAASSDTLMWYTSATGGTGSKTPPSPSTSTVGTSLYYVSAKTASGCESERDSITVIVIPSIIHVDSSVATSGTGDSWASPIKTLYDALSLAHSADCSPQIWVKKGTYYPTADGNRDSSFRIYHNGIKVYGGFAGTETILSARSVSANTTILSGDINTTGDSSDNSYHVVTMFGASPNQIDSTTVLDGFTIRAGNGFASTGSFTFSGMNFNHQDGAGIYLYAIGSTNNCSPTISNCTITRNAANYGGGIYGAAFYSGNASPLLSNNIFVANTANSNGGAVFLNAYSSGLCSATIDSCTFNANIASDGAGLYTNSVLSAATTVIVSNSSFTANQTSSNGAAIYNYGNGANNCSNVVFQNNTSSNGAAVYNNTTGSVSLSACTFSSNNGAVNGGAVFQGNSGTLNLSRCVFSANIASNSSSGTGGAVYLSGSGTSQISNCIFSGNQSLGASGNGGGAIAIQSSHTATLENTSCYNNTTASTSSANSNTLGSVSGSTVTLRNSIVWGTAANQVDFLGTITYTNSLVKGTGLTSPSLDTDPLFKNETNPIGVDGIWLTDDDGLELKPCSPAVNAATTAAPTYDIRNRARFGTAPDMGAYEEQTGAIATAPIVSSPINYCLNASSSALTASKGSAIDTLYWFASDTGGIGTTTAPTPNTTTTGTTNYYVSAKNTYGCTSARVLVSVYVSPSLDPFQITTPDSVLCIGESTKLFAPANDSLNSSGPRSWQNAGLMFDIVGKTALTINGIDFATLSTSSDSFSIYTRPGTHEGFESSSAGWTLIGTALSTSIGSSRSTLPFPISLNLRKDERIALYITRSGTSNNLVFHSGVTTVGSVLVEDSNMQLIQGISPWYPFSLASGKTPYSFNGKIHYKKYNTLWSTAATTDSILVAPSSTTKYWAKMTNWIGCSVTDTIQVQVDPLPTISGTMSACVGNTRTLTGSATAHLTSPWTSSDTTVAKISSTGVVTGIAAGSTTITYKNTNDCSQTSLFTVNPLPTISGTLNACIGTGSTLTASDAPDTTSSPWSSSNTAVATISSTGVISTLSVGTTTISYKNINKCVQSVTFTVNPLPTISGTLKVCVGSSVSLTGSATAATSSPWTSSNTAIATVTSAGVVTGVAGGTATITYKNSNGCTQTTIVTVNPLPTISGTLNACIGAGSTLTSSDAPDTTSAAWSSSNTAVATISSTGVLSTVSVGTTTISYKNVNKCVQSVTFTVNPLPTISGTLNTCVGSSTSLTGSGSPDPTTPWTSSNVSIASVSSAGVVTGVSSGTATITYKNSNGCIQSASITVNPLPSISGTLNVCVGNTTTLSGSATAHATTPWTSSNTAIATISSSGIVTGVSGGTVTITYKNSNGCTQSVFFSVNPLPSISGTLSACVDATSSLTGSAAPHPTTPWASSNTAVASVSAIGVVTGITAGTTTITYQNSNGCIKTASFTVNPLPTKPLVTTPLNLCIGTPASALTATGSSLKWYTVTTGGVASSSITPSTTALGSTNYYVSQTNSFGCEGPRETLEVIVNPLPIVSIVSISSTGLIFCKEKSITLKAIATTATQYQWAFKGNNISGAIADTILADTTGIYRVQVKDVYGCQNKDSVYAQKDTSIIPVLSPTEAMICEEGGQLLTVHPGYVGYVFEWIKDWTPLMPATPSSNIRNATIPGSYLVIVTNNVGCIDTTEAAIINNYPKPTKPTIINSDPLLEVTNSYRYYQWYRNGAMIVGANSFRYLTSSSGYYSVEVSDENGCLNQSDTVQIIAATSIGNTIVASELKVYPNPTKSRVYIEAPIKVNVKVTDIVGKLILEIKDAKEIDLHNFSDGNYMLMISDEHNQLISIEKISKIQ